MKKKFFSVMLIFTVSTSLLACGNKAEEPVKEEPETSVVEEAKAEPEPVVEDKEAADVEDDPEEKEPEKDYAYAQLYLTEIAKLYNSGNADQFALVNVDGDDIPELVAIHSDYNEGYNSEGNGGLYTVYENKIVLLVNNLYQTIGYSEGNNLIRCISMGGVGTTEKFEKINDGKAEILLCADINSGIETDETTGEAYSKTTYLIDEQEVSEQNFNEKINEIIDEYYPITILFGDGIYITDDDNEREYNKPYMTYEEITAELSKLRAEADAEKYKNVEPWKLAYRNCLYDIMSKTVLLGDGGEGDWNDYGDNVIFTMNDITDDGIPELLASGNWPVLQYGRAPYWNIFFYDGDGGYKHDYGDNMEFYDTESKKIYSQGSGGSYFWYGSYVIRGGNLVDDITMLLNGEDYEDDVFEYTEYDENGNEKSTKVVAKNDWDSFVASYNAGLEKYGIRDYVELTPENINKELGLSSESNKSEKKNEKSDNSLYTVEVTAPDGYVNFRTGAGTDFEIISPISNGETLSVISDEGKWLQVEYKGKTGWVASSQVTKKVENNADSLLDKFIKGEIPAYRHDEYTGKTSSFKITDLPIDEDDSYSYHIGERIDLDNDGEKELILDGADGGMYLDAQNGKIIVLAESDGTASRLSHVTYDGAIWIVYSDTSHAGRQWYELKKYNGAGDVVDSFELSAEYWDSPNDQYNTNSDFHYRGKKISMQEYEDLIKKIFGK